MYDEKNVRRRTKTNGTAAPHTLPLRRSGSPFHGLINGSSPPRDVSCVRTIRFRSAEDLTDL
jgi:hypothetical protein